MEPHGPGRLEEVRVAVGELSAVEPELLKFAWEAVTAGGRDAAARLEIDWRVSRQNCEACGEIQERPAGSWLPLCPRCGGPLAIEGGRELDILQISFTPDGTDEAGGAGEADAAQGAQP
jgi:hydrogenase nickel incorporation protein HypA/HybF